LLGNTADRSRTCKSSYFAQRQKVFDLCEVHKTNPLSSIEAQCRTLMNIRSRLSCGSLRE